MFQKLQLAQHVNTDSKYRKNPFYLNKFKYGNKKKSRKGDGIDFAGLAEKQVDFKYKRSNLSTMKRSTKKGQNCLFKEITKGTKDANLKDHNFNDI